MQFSQCAAMVASLDGRSGPMYIETQYRMRRSAMGSPVLKRDVAISMRFREDDLGIIDRGAELNGLSRTEFVRRAALHEAQTAILNEMMVRMSREAFDHFVQAISAPAEAAPAKMRERLSRKSPWPER
jgi:uncharacterized protein (DUF1778 family)